MRGLHRQLLALVLALPIGATAALAQERAPQRGEWHSLPVQIFYQPSFWLSVELRLDDGADVPADPATDGSVLTRIRSICRTVAPFTSHRD